MAVSADKKRLLDILRSDAVTRGDFTLASGKKSTYYINVKKVILKPEGCLLSAKTILSMLPRGIKAVGAVPLGAVPIVSAMIALSFTEKNPVDGFVIRKEPKGYGTDKLIEGDVRAGMKVAIIEDVVTTGGSVVKAVRTAREYGLDVSCVIALVDREEGGRELIQAEEVSFEAAFTIKEVLG